MYKVCQGIKCTNTCILYIKEFINLIHNSYINHAKIYDSDCSPLTKKKFFPTAPEWGPLPHIFLFIF